MYIPKHFKEDDLDSLLKLMDEHSFATLVTVSESAPFASHPPLLIEKSSTLKLVGHLAKANEQWRHFESSPQAEAIFHGPHAYISPSFYQTPGVPTWNYAAIHVYGKPRLIQDATRLKDIVETLAMKYEKNQKAPWEPRYSLGLLDAIVGFEMEIERIEGKYKLSQNRAEADRSNIIDLLSASSSDACRSVAELMREREEAT
jgi:transcriptional regulator